MPPAAPMSDDASQPPPHVQTGAWSPDRVRTASLVVLAAVAACAGLWAGRDVFVPLALAAAFASVLRPLVRGLRDHARLPVPAGAALVLCALLGALGAAGVALEEPAHDLMNDAPQLVAKARTRIDELRRPLQRVTQAIDGSGGRARGGRRSADATAAGAAGAAGGSGIGPIAGPVAGIAGVPPNEVGVALGRLFGTTAGLIASAAEVLLLMYFLLAGDDRFLRRLVGGLHDAGAKRTAVEVVRESEAHVARYLGTLLLISTGQGVVVALALWALHVPSPIVWGLATVVLETLPYLGAAVMVTGLTIIGLASTGSVAGALAPPATYLLVSTLQNSFVSPIAYGRRLRLNPFAILVAVLAGYALWGVAGVFLAVPAAAALNVLAEHVEALAPVGAFLRE
ncbi:AI-2E family transporter [Gemmatimonadetes bacterium T265]|nr:AI-2E family transporter [Gemmatimonadetes bacterium T265]